MSTSTRSPAVLVAALAALAACSHRGESGPVPAEVAEVPPPAPRHPNPEAALADCAEALGRVAAAESDVVYSIVADGCAGLFAEPVCQQAVRRSPEVDPAERASMMARACAEAYCPHLAEPRPALCGEDGSGLAATDLAVAWRELVVAARRLDFGDRAEAVARVDPFAMAATAVSVPVEAQAAPPREEAAVRLALSTSPAGVTVEGRCPPAPPVTIDASPSATAEELASRLAALGCLGPGTSTVVAAGSSVPYAAVVTLLDALRLRGVDRFALETAPGAP